jgi:protein-tyrosine phosphatase
MSSIKFNIFKTDQVDFIVFNSPNDNNLLSIKELNNAVNLYNINLIFRLCEPLYKKDDIYDCDIIDLEIKDGSFPNEEMINKYLLHIDNNLKDSKKTCIGIHCRGGLGRSPVFLGIGIMNYKKYNDNYDIIKLIRDNIKGSLNIVQLTGLSKYKPKRDLKSCIIC